MNTGGLLPPPLNSSRARLSARLDDGSEGQVQENPTGSEQQDEIDLKTQLKGACAELGLGSIEESLQLPALVKLCWTLHIAADQGYEPPLSPVLDDWFLHSLLLPWSIHLGWQKS